MKKGFFSFPLKKKGNLSFLRPARGERVGRGLKEAGLKRGDLKTEGKHVHECDS